MSAIRTAVVASLTVVTLGSAWASPAAAAAATPASAPAAVTAGSAKATYPLPPRALPEQLAASAQSRLPTIAAKTRTILGDAMDQPDLLPVQVVSALHIRRAFRKDFGAAGFRSALRISWRESRLLPNVVNDTNTNGTNDWGLFQLNDGGTLQYAGGAPGDEALRPSWNARAAARLVAEVGWGPWGGML